MAREYFCCFHAYRKKTEKLSDQELGRLFRALMEYSEFGETQELAGRESIAFDFIAADIDAANEKYETACKSHAESGNKGGRPKKTKENQKNQTKPFGFSETKTPQTRNKKQETKNQIVIPPLPPFDSPEMQSAFDDWMAYKKERREDYKPMGEKSLVTRLKNEIAERGEDAVIEAIRYSMAQGWKGIFYPDGKKTAKKNDSDRVKDALVEWMEE